MRRLPRVLSRFVLLAMILPAPLADAAEPDQEPPIGRKVADFALKDYRGKSHSLSELRDSSLVVVAFLGTECPLAKLYGARLTTLEDEYAAKGVAFLGINANRQDSLTEIAAYARVHGIQFPILKDLGNAVADQLGAVRTPEVFVLDSERVVRYWGRIDDQYGVGSARDEPTVRHLAAALDELLANKPVTTPVVEALGCFIGRIREAQDDAEVTWSNQIARLFNRRCVECHREGEIAPFSLTSYDEVAGWGDTIAEVVRENRMPPWHASPEHGHFADDRRLTDDERAQIFAWVKAGMPEGDPAELPERPQFLSGWQLPRMPDLVVKMRDKPFAVPAEGAVEYKYFEVDPGFTEDKWVHMAQARPGNRAVVHHILILVRPPEDYEGTGGGGGEFLVGYVPGMRHRPYADGMAKLVPAGSKLVFQMHYTPNGAPQEDVSEVGFVFADPQKIDHLVVTSMAANPRFRIPPHDANHRVEGTSNRHGADVLLLSMSPHMHLRGKSFTYEAVYPDGRREMLLDVPRYDFNWQTAYRLREPKVLPAGTRVHAVAHFDNSADNLANPDPAATVTWGDQTWNEMMIGYFDIAIPLDKAAQLSTRRRDRARDAREKLRQRVQELMKQYDGNQDGKISRNEVPERLVPVFGQLDADKDDALTEDELTSGLTRLSNQE